LSYNFKASEEFWKNFYNLSATQKASARFAWGIFRENPFDSRLKPHRINALSGRAGRPIWSIFIEDDLRVVFYVSGSTVFSVDIGTHDVYR
jgi:mRNA-degrading endonuclease YafQ of YafQ-DinJ toxin-antitoxin module